jgi:hypothetical protein
MRKRRKAQVAWASFKSNKALEAIPVKPEDVPFYVSQIRAKFPRHGASFRPIVEFYPGSGKFGRRGDANGHTQVIRLFKTGQTLAVLLHEFAHLLAPDVPGRPHGPEFYQTCDAIEKALF